MGTGARKHTTDQLCDSEPPDSVTTAPHATTRKQWCRNGVSCRPPSLCKYRNCSSPGDPPEHARSSDLPQFRSSIPVLNSGAQLRYSIPVLNSGAARSSTEAFCGGEIYTAGMLHAFTEWRRSEPYVRNVKQAKKREARPPHRSCGPPPSPRRPCPSRYRSVFSRWAYDSPRSARPCAQSLRACFPRCA